ncbi:HvfX family Cu-binding RiPP maturation protein [Pseudomonas sp. MDT1-85]
MVRHNPVGARLAREAFKPFSHIGFSGAQAHEHLSLISHQRPAPEPFPFNHVPATLNWELAMWAELICALALLVGLGTRVSAIILTVVTIVATAAVHWPADWSTLSELAQGYAISNKGHGNFKLPLIYLVALMPLLLSGAGKLSVDALLARYFWRRSHR